VAEEWSVTPRASAALVYDSNPRMFLEGEDNTGVVTDLAADFAWRTEVSSLTFTPRLRVNRYERDRDAMDSDDQYYTLGASTATERGKYGVDASLSYATALTTEDIVAETGVLRRDARTSRDSWALSPRFSYILTERNTLSGDFTLSAVDYDGGGYRDYQFYLANLALGHALSPRDTVSGILYLSQYDRLLREDGDPFGPGVFVAGDVEAASRSIGLQVGYERKLTETVTGTVAVGAVRTDFEADAVRLSTGGGADLFPDSTDYGQLLTAKLTQRLERGEWDLGLTRNLTPTGDGVLVRRDEAKAGYRRELGPRSTARAALVVFQEESVGGQVNVANRDYALVEGGVSYRLTPYLVLSGKYVYRYEKYESADDAATANAVWLTLAYEGDKHAISR
jgi:hypothetical protein